MSCKGLHCPGCGSGGSGGFRAALVIGGIVMLAVAGSAGEHEARALAGDVFTVAAITALSVAGLALAALVTGLILRARHIARERAANRPDPPAVPWRAEVIDVWSAYPPHVPESDARELPAASAWSWTPAAGERSQADRDAW